MGRARREMLVRLAKSDGAKELGEIGLPRKGQEVQIHSRDGQLAKLAKCSGGKDWFLSHNGRCRFGNASEIREDIKHFQEYNSLPQRKQGWA